ncbi:MAG: Abi family protein [Candidatus Adiutrix sp.]|jgi:hypothetical protein|nr:Abi family protein [Candidatus Adiutrix sp.]
MTLPSAAVPYPKPFTDIAEQIERLEERGLAIDDRKTAEFWLKKVGYYRLSGYWYELRERDDSIALGSRKDTFKSGSALSEVIELYRFDERWKTGGEAGGRKYGNCWSGCREFLAGRGSWAFLSSGSGKRCGVRINGFLYRCRFRP